MRTFYRHILPVLGPLLLIASLLWSLWFVFAGFGNHMDPLYWLYKYQHLDGGWMSAGTLLFGHFCVRVFGAQLLPLRLIGWGITVLAIALPYICLLTPKQRLDNLHWLALAYFMMGYGAFQELSPGTLTVLLLVLIALFAIRYLHSPTLLSAIFIGLFTGVAIAVRFPNILVIIPLLPVFALPVIRSEEGQTHRICINALSALVALAASAGTIYWLSAELLTFSTTDPSMGGTHGIAKMITNLWDKGALLLGFAALWYGIVAIGRKSWYWAVPVAAGVGYYTTYAFGEQWYNIDLTYCLSAACVVSALASKRSALAFLTAMLAIATMGTDVAWLKLFPAVLALIPVLPKVYPAKMRTYLYLVLIGFAIPQTIRFAVNSVGNSDLYASTTRAGIAPYKGIYIDSKSNTYLEQLSADYQCYGVADNTISVGSDIHLIRSVTGCQAGAYNEFWSNIFDSVYTARYEPLIIEKQPVVFCAFSPQFKTKKSYKDKNSAFEQMLMRNGYKPIDRSQNKYMIYLPNKPQP